MGYKLNVIEGDVAVGRHIEAGGDLDIQGKGRIAGSLKVEGFLDAPHIKGAAKGLFQTEEDLNREYPNPRAGWFAIVRDENDETKGFLYMATNGEWVKTSRESRQFDFIMDSINVFASKLELAAETDRAMETEVALQKKIKDETERAKAAEQTLQDNISTETERAKAAEDRLLKRIQGNAEVSDGRREPFVSLGAFSDMASFVEHLGSMHANTSVEYGKYNGKFRAMVSASLIEVINNVTYIANDQWVQAIRGNIMLNNGKLSLASTHFGSFYRSHNANGWSEWQIANKEAITSIARDEANKAVAAAVGELPDVLESLREIAEWIEQNGEEVENIYKGIGDNQKAIEAEIIRATEAESANAGAVTAETERAMNAEKALSDRIDNIPTGGGGTGDIADGAVTERKLSTDVKNKLNTAYDKANLADTLFVNDGITFIQGAIANNGDIYTGTNYVATSLPIYSGGERITVNSGYKITKYVLYYYGEAVDGGDVNDTYFDSFELAGTESAFIRIEVRRTDDNAISSNEFPNIVKSFIRKPIAWSASCNMNNFVCAGDYRLSGSRVANAQDNMPIYNAGNIEAKLEVLVDGTTVAQKLTLLNAGGGDGNVYTRVKQDGAWKPWGKLQTNIEVGRVEGSNAFDGFIDNGMYSGVYAYDNNVETFVLVVLNAYLYGGGVSQLKYSLTLDGVVSVKTRSRQGDVWSEWTDK